MVSILQGVPSPIFKNNDLVIHNCDEIPTETEVSTLAHHFRSIFSVNYLGDNKNVFPLPIGLENKCYLRNGVPRDYFASSLRHREEREINFLFAFSTHTNPKERTQALSYASKLENSHVVSGPITPRKYRSLIRNSRFVVSPPGNGPDCHRTWESLYLGAIPIVKTKFWPFTKVNLPVIQIKDWNELEAISPSMVVSELTPWTSINYWLERPLRLT